MENNEIREEKTVNLIDEKDYQQMRTILKDNLNITLENKPWFYGVYEQLIGMDVFEKEEILQIKGLMLKVLYQEYRYFEADKLASELLEEGILPWRTLYSLAEFYSQTRRYDEADAVISDGNKLYAEDDVALGDFNSISEKNNKRKIAASEGKKEYLPNTNKDPLARDKYIEFMNSLGITVTVPSKIPTPIREDEYPEPVEKIEADFDSFVAFDFETTGKETGKDAIIEVGAVRVVNGQIIESAEFTFQEFVKPYKKALPAGITELTGITKDDLKDARPMWEVIPDFMKFVGDDILVGYNNVNFDAKFLRRAGRYSHEIYTNKQFDVLKYANKIINTIGYTGANMKLVTVGEYFGIENPEAHRALADAVTTAKIYLKLRELSG